MKPGRILCTRNQARPQTDPLQKAERWRLRAPIVSSGSKASRARACLLGRKPTAQPPSTGFIPLPPRTGVQSSSQSLRFKFRAAIKYIWGQLMRKSSYFRENPLLKSGCPLTGRAFASESNVLKWGCYVKPSATGNAFRRGLVPPPRLPCP